MTLTKLLRVTESKSFEFRLEGFNVFNHAQFYGAASVDGEVNDPILGESSARRLRAWSSSPRNSLSRNES
jgi:hypothetical protein